MPLLPTYTPFWGAQPWENLPRTETPIIAASLKHIDDALAAQRNRIEEVAEALAGSDSGQIELLSAKADKATKVTAGTGLSGGGDLSAERTLSVKYGTAAGTATEGNDQRVIDAVKTPTGVTIAAGDLLVGRADGKVQRLPVGSVSGQALLVDPTAATGLRWNVPSSDGLTWSAWALVPHVNNASSSPALMYRVRGDEVQLRGLVQMSVATGVGTVAAVGNLPAAARPVAKVLAHAHDTTSVIIDPSGSIGLQNNTVGVLTSTAYSFSAISYITS